LRELVLPYHRLKYYTPGCDRLRSKRDGWVRMHRVPIYRVQLIRDGSCKLQGRNCNGPAEAVSLFRAVVGDADREHLVAMFLNTQNQFVGVHTISIGNLDSAITHPREVFKAAILANAASLVLAHNHPSGDCVPSQSDLRMTGQMVQVGNMLGIPIMDHVIVGHPDYVSLLVLGLVPGLCAGEWQDPDEQHTKRRRKKQPVLAPESSG
jgi:DNA repair protein RadC